MNSCLDISNFMNSNIVDGERFAWLNIHGFSTIKVFMEIFCVALAMSTHYLV